MREVSIVPWHSSNEAEGAPPRAKAKVNRALKR